MKIRKVKLEDKDVIYEWANDNLMREMSFSQDEIKYPEHVKWFENRLKNENCYMFIMTHDDGTPVGQIRFEVKNDSALVSVGLAPEWRGKGLGALLIEKGVSRFAEESSVDLLIAKIKIKNIASQKSFSSAGFTVQEPGGQEGFLVFVKRLS